MSGNSAAYTKVLSAAADLANQRLLVENITMTNQPRELKERVELSARYMIESDKLKYLRAAYDTAMEEYTQSELASFRAT